MVIELFTGFPGGGKSFNATKIGTQLADGRFHDKYVIANFPIKPKKTLFSRWRKVKENKPRWIYKTNEELTVQYLVQLSIDKGWVDKESSALIIFDEAGIPFNSRAWNAKDRMEWIQFLSQHRKFGYDVIFITQDGKMIDRQIRSLAEYEVVHRKMNNMFAFKWLSLFRITLFACVSYWNGERFGKGQLRLQVYNKKTALRYDSMNLFDFDKMLLKDDKPSKVVNIKSKA
ncbi:MAG TPA: zonular occludens toxin domain-containing protein [Candidatus Nitrosocosmicus sp.]|nr:zonular occludens toxin domain-containing protein [Candidatus Nitrosocosmicus sp.]